MDEYEDRFLHLYAGIRLLEESAEGPVQLDVSQLREVIAVIKTAGETHDESKAEWLAAFTQVDGWDSLGEKFVLASAALIALSQMPDAALLAAANIMRHHSQDSSSYRKVGIIRILSASATPRASALLKQFIDDPNNWVRTEARTAMNHVAKGE